MKKNKIPVLTITAKSGSGKTTLLEILIAELKAKEYKVATVKHHSHSGFQIDKQGKDSWRFAQAGSDHVIIAAPDKIASYQLLEQELTLDEILSTITNVDIILVEGYMRARQPTIEIIRASLGTEIISSGEQLIALVTDIDLDVKVPQFNINAVPKIVEFVEHRMIRGLK
jgi:molybdopterin-guanine dinucleotide biosynthesis adapter protein